MKRFITLLLVFSMAHFNTAFSQEEDSDYYGRTGSAAMDGTADGLSISMMGWGIGLAIGIAILAAVLHQSREGSGSSGHNHCN